MIDTITQNLTIDIILESKISITSNKYRVLEVLALLFINVSGKFFNSLNNLIVRLPHYLSFEHSSMKTQNHSHSRLNGSF